MLRIHETATRVDQDRLAGGLPIIARHLVGIVKHHRRIDAAIELEAITLEQIDANLRRNRVPSRSAPATCRGPD